MRIFNKWEIFINSLEDKHKDIFQNIKFNTLMENILKFKCQSVIPKAPTCLLEDQKERRKALMGINYHKANRKQKSREKNSNW